MSQHCCQAVASITAEGAEDAESQGIQVALPVLEMLCVLRVLRGEVVVVT